MCGTITVKDIKYMSQETHFTQKDRDEHKQLSTAMQEHFKADLEFQETVNDGISELRRILIDQNRDFKSHSETLVAHMKRVEPMITGYEKSNIFSEELAKKGKWAVAVAGGALVLLSFWAIFKGWITPIK